MKRGFPAQRALFGGAGALTLLIGGIVAMAVSDRLATGPVIPAPAPLPSPNGFDVYLAAARALVPAQPPVDRVNDGRALTPQQAAKDYAPARRRAWIERNALAWSLMSRAQTLPSRQPNLRGLVGDFKPWRELRALARCQTIRVHEWKDENRWNDALGAGLDGMAMGRNIERGGPLIGSLVAIAIEHIGEHSIEDVPAHLSASEAQAGAKRLEKMIALAQPFAQVLSEEKWSLLTMLKRQNAAPHDAQSLLRTVLVPRQKAASSVATMMDEFAAQADKPFGLQRPVPPPAVGVFANLNFANILYPVFGRAAFNDARRQSLERLLLVRLALRAYRAEHGAYPTKLNDLTPAIVSQVPVDPFGKGEALRYRRTSDSYLAWSIGPDGVDNGGAPLTTPRGKHARFVAPESRGDIVARP